MPSWITKSCQKDSEKQRKRWELEDKKLIENLRYQLAEDGNPECQFLLAKQLLDDDESDPKRKVQGISYLKKAAENGHEMALELLAACYRTGRGITSLNESEIRKFLELSPAERTARRAAQELFNSLCNGNEYVTVEQLERRMREIYNLQKWKSNQRKGDSCQDAKSSIEKNDNDDDDGGGGDEFNGKKHFHGECSQSKSIHSNENYIYESNLYAAAQSYSHGVIPAINQSLSLSMPDSQALQQTPIFYQPFFHPILFFSLLYHRLVSIFSTAPSEIFKNYKMLILLLAYMIVASPGLKISVSTTGYYFTFFTMIFATFKMLKSKHQFIEFKIWSGLFLSYNENVYAEDSENLYIRKSMTPYLWFFFAFIINIMLFPFIESDWCFASEVATISIIFFLVTFFCFMFTSSHNPDFTVLLSVLLNIFAKYPHVNLTASSIDWTVMDAKIPLLGYNVEFSLSFRAVLYITISICMLLLAKRNNWKGIYQFFFPHAVTLTWLQIFLINLHSASNFGLIRSSIVVTVILFFLPIVFLSTLLIPVFLFIEWLSISDYFNRIIITLSTTLVAVAGSVFLAFSNRSRKYVTSVQILLSIFTIFILLRPIIMENKDNTYASYLHQASDNDIIDLNDRSIKLTWEMYYNYCIQPEVENKNTIAQQIRCNNHLNGSPVYWNGVVTKIRIYNIKNWRKALIENYMPEFLKSKIICLFGEKNSARCAENEKCEIKDFVEEQNTCNLDKWNVYDYEVESTMTFAESSGILNLKPRQEVKIILIANHDFKNFTTNLHSNDKIWFQGLISTKIENYCSNYYPRFTSVKLTSIGCIECKEKSLLSVAIKKKLIVDNVLNDLTHGLKYLLNFIFNPLVTFK